jgi:hypothetical protein
VTWGVSGVEWGEIGGGVVSSARGTSRGLQDRENALDRRGPKGIQRGNPRVESCKSIFFGVDPGEGVQTGHISDRIERRIPDNCEKQAVDHPAVAFLLNDLALQ